MQKSISPIRFEIADNLAIITLAEPPVNSLGQPMRAAILAAIQRAGSDPAIQAVVLTGNGRVFCGGADVAEFAGNGVATPDLNEVHAEIEALGKPVVAALNGAALGGGLELAMSCHLRVATPVAKLGLPEVQLGLLPGAGGTQRLPRLIGVKAALEMIRSGAAKSASQAKAAGLIDEVIEGDLVLTALARARQLAESGMPLRRTSALLVDTADLAPEFFAETRASTAKQPHGALAQRAIIDTLEVSVLRSFSEGIEFERAEFMSLLKSPESRALQHLFFAEREAAKIPNLPKDIALRQIRKVGIVGAGTMGGGIAMNFINATIPVVILELKEDALERGVGRVRKNYEATASKGRMTAAQVEERMALLKGTLSHDDLADCDLVVEAAFENLALKKDICARLGAVCRPGAIIATNTSTLDVDVLAEASGRPSDFVGMHFFSPANVMRLLEVVRGTATAPDVLATVMALAKKINKVAVVSGVCYGFIGNRMMESYVREADNLLMEGATPAQIDRVLEGFGMAMGPCRVLDMAGADVCANVIEERTIQLGGKREKSYRAVVRALNGLGRYGQKAGAGYYRYDGRNAVPDPAVDKLAAELAEASGIKRRTDIGDTEILERCLYPLIDEGARILEEGIAYRSSDIDVVWTAGYGFPREKGGPMHYAGQVGLAAVHERLLAYGRKHKNAYGYWTPAPLLTRLVAEGKDF